MARMNRRWVVALSLLLAVAGGRALGQSLPRGSAAEQSFDPQKLRQIDATLQHLVEGRQIAGAAAVVIRDGRIVHEVMVGNADVEAGRPIAADTIYRIASMTKPITSVAAMMLVEQGKLKLDDPVSRYIPAFADAVVLVPVNDQQYRTVPAKRPITIHDLLTHTSGISYGLFDKPHLGKLYREAGVSDGIMETPGVIGDNARRIAKVPLANQPGEAWEYGLNTDVLGHVIEVASGQTLDEFFRERIFKPLKMNDTYFIVPPAKRERLAALYLPGNDPNKTIVRVPPGPQKMGAVPFSATYPIADGSTYYSGGAGLSSTIGDYARFLQMLLNGGELDGARLLQPQTVALMTRNHIGEHRVIFPGHGDGFGYGFGVVTPRLTPTEEPAPVGSYSWGGLWSTYFWVDPRNKLIGLLMTQLPVSPHMTAREDFKRMVYAAMQQ